MIDHLFITLRTFLTDDSSERRLHHRVDDHEVCDVCDGPVPPHLVLAQDHAVRQATQSPGKVKMSHVYSTC